MSEHSNGIGLKVDALYLMLDGYNSGALRVRRDWVGLLEFGELESPGKERTMPAGMAEVAEAILELEGDNGYGPLARDAAAEARRRGGHSAGCPRCGFGGLTDEDKLVLKLEAAALLRDGWRPRGWRAAR